MGTFTQLDDGDIAALAAAFGLGPVRRWSAIAAGTINSNFSVHTAAGRFFLRINEGKSAADVRFEADLVTALARAGVPAALPRVAQAGAPFLEYQGHLASVFPWVPGEHVAGSGVTAVRVAAVGAALARMHVAGLELALQRESIYTFAKICERVAGIEAGQAARPDPALAPALGEVRREIDWLIERAAVCDAARRGIIHGDLFPDNVLFAGDAIAALLDFEQASTGSLCYDLAVCVNAWCFDRDPEPELVAALLDGYQSVRPLASAEVRALPVEVRAAAMRFTVTRITDLYLAGEDKPDKHFDHFLRRLLCWRRIGAEDLLHWGRL
jgi:homoserine kinase type II